MSNRGVYPGLTPDTWRDYEPRLVATVTSGTTLPTEPSLGSDGTAMGRYMQLPGGFIIAQAHLVFGTAANGATAGGSPNPSHAWMVSLPRPANRWTAITGANADLPIGTGLLRTDPSGTQALTMPCIPTLADPFVPHAWQQGQDEYAQLFCAHSLETGTASISGTATSTTVTHHLGITPTASDVVCNISSLTGSPAAIRNVYLTNFTSTTFDINVQVAPGGTTAVNFTWKIRAEPNSSATVTPLVNHGRPWAWGERAEIKLQMIYEAQF